MPIKDKKKSCLTKPKKVKASVLGMSSIHSSSFFVIRYKIMYADKLLEPKILCKNKIDYDQGKSVHFLA